MVEEVSDFATVYTDGNTKYFTVTAKVKEEISKIESSESEQIAELSGYIRNNSIISKNKITTTTESECIVDRITKIIKASYELKKNNW